MSNKLLIVNSSLPEVDKIMLSLRENVNVVFYDENKDYSKLLEEIQEKDSLYTHVGFMFVNNSINSDNWLNVSEKNVVQCVEMADPNLSSWSNFDNFLRKLKKMVCFKFFDLVTCNAYDNDWKYIINTLKQRGIYVRASVNITGYQGDWILESDNVDMREVYFNENIMEWKHSLEPIAKGSNFLLGSDNKVYGFGDNETGNLGKITLFISEFEELKFNVIGETIKKFVTSKNKIFVLTNSGKLYARGQNKDGENSLGINSTYIISEWTQCVEFVNDITSTTTNSSSTRAVTGVSNIWVGRIETLILKTNGDYYVAGNRGSSDSSFRLYNTNSQQLLPFCKVTKHFISGGFLYGKGDIIDYIYTNFYAVNSRLIVTNDSDKIRFFMLTQNQQFVEFILPQGEELQTYHISNESYVLAVVSKTGRLYILSEYRTTTATGGFYPGLSFFTNSSNGFDFTVSLFTTQTITAESNTKYVLPELSSASQWPTGKRVSILSSYYTGINTGTFYNRVNLYTNNLYAIMTDGSFYFIRFRGGNTTWTITEGVFEDSFPVIPSGLTISSITAINNNALMLKLSNNDIWLKQDSNEFNQLGTFTPTTTYTVSNYWYKITLPNNKRIKQFYTFYDGTTVLSTTDNFYYISGNNSLYLSNNVPGTNFDTIPRGDTIPDNKVVKEIVTNTWGTLALTTDGSVYGSGLNLILGKYISVGRQNLLNIPNYYSNHVFNEFTKIDLPYESGKVLGQNRLNAKQIVTSRHFSYFLMTNGEIYIAGGDDFDIYDENGGGGNGYDILGNYSITRDYVDGFYNVSKRLKPLNGLIPVKLAQYIVNNNTPGKYIVPPRYDDSYGTRIYGETFRMPDYLYILMSNGNLYRMLNLQKTFNNIKWDYELVTLPAELLTNNNRVIDVTCGTNHIVIHMKNGQIATMGSNSSGQLAINRTPEELESTTTFNIVPLPSGVTIKKVRCGETYNIFLTTTGKVYTNGNNEHGQLGVASPNNQLGLTELLRNGASLNAVDIYVQNTTTIIKLSNGDIYGCGNNSKGQLGIGYLALDNNIKTLTKLSLPTDVSFNFPEYETAALAKIRGVTIPNLLANYPLVDVLSSGITINEALENGITSFSSLKAHFSTADLLNSGFTRAQVLNGGFSAKQLKDAQFTPGELVDASYSRIDIMTAGFDLGSLIAANFEISELKPYYSVQQMFDYGVPVTKLLGLYSLSAFVNYNFTVSYLKGFGYTAKNFRDNGFLKEKILDTANVKFSSRQLLEASYNVFDLKNAGYSASELRVDNAYSAEQVVKADYSLAQLKAANITPSEIKLYSTTYSDSQILNAGFSLILLKNANLDILDIKNTVDSSGIRVYTDSAILSSGFLVTDLSRANYSVSQLKSNGYRPADLKNIYPDNQIISGGYDISLIKLAGYMPSQIYQNYTVEEMIRVNYTKHSILSASGIDVSQCRIAGYGVFDMRPYFSPLQLRVGGYNNNDILNKELKYSVAEYKLAGYSPSELKAKEYNKDDILKAGYNLSDLVSAGYGISDVRPYYNLTQIKAAYQKDTIVASLASLNFSLADLIGNGFGDILTVANMRYIYKPREIKDASSQWIDDIINNVPKFPASDMLEASFNIVDIKTKYSPDELKQGGYNASDIWSAYDKNTYTIENMKNKVFTAKELADNGFNASGIVRANYTITQLKTANIPFLAILNAFDSNDNRLYPDDTIIRNYNLTELKNNDFPLDKIMDFIAVNPGIYTRLQVITERFPASNMKNYFSVSELRSYKYGESEIIGAGYPASELVPFYNPGLLVANYNKQQIINAGYTISRLRSDLSLNPTELKNSDKYPLFYTDSLIISSNFAIQELKDASYTPFQIRNVTNAYYSQMLTVGYSLTQLFDASYTPINIKDIQRSPSPIYYSDNAIGNSGLWSVSQLKEAGFTPSQLKTYVTGSVRNYSDDQILSGGFSIASLKDAGFSPNQLLSSGYNSADIVNANYSASVMFDNSNNFSPSILKQNPVYTVTTLKNVGYNDESLIRAKYPIKDYKDALYSLDTLITYGLKPIDLRDFVTPANGYPDNQILSNMNFSISDLKQGRFTLLQVKTARSGLTDIQLKNGGFTADDFDKSGYTLAQLISFGNANGAKFTQNEIFQILNSNGTQKYKREHILNCGISPDNLATLRGTSDLSNNTQIPMCQVYKHNIWEKRPTDSVIKRIATKYYDLNNTGVYIREYISGTTLNNQFTTLSTYTEFDSTGKIIKYDQSPKTFVAPNVEVTRTVF